jgi:hypothetical protein
MLLIILALFWVAILAPVVVRRFRDSGTERSIDSFHAEHEVLSRQGYVVPPAHRLDRPDHEEVRSQAHRPRLTVVHADDTYRTLETRNSWDEWSEAYDYDRDEAESRPAAPTNRYASAYSSVPSEPEVRRHYEAPARRRSMKARRKVLFVRTALAAVVLTATYFAVGFSIIEDLAILAWVALVSATWRWLSSPSVRDTSTSLRCRFVFPMVASWPPSPRSTARLPRSPTRSSTSPTG